MTSLTLDRFAIMSLVENARPLSEMRDLLSSWTAAGATKEAIRSVLNDIRSELEAAGREAEEDRVLEALDLVEGWVSPHLKLVFPERAERAGEDRSSFPADDGHPPHQVLAGVIDMRTTDAGTDPVLVDRSIESLLRLGQETWDELCAAGVLDPSNWTEDEKWTAIGMLWHLPVSDIAAIRFVMAKAPLDVPGDEFLSTYEKMTAVRRKCAPLFDETSKELRLERGLPHPDHDDSDPGSPT